MVKSNVAIVGPRVRFSAGRLFSLPAPAQHKNPPFPGGSIEQWIVHPRQLVLCLGLPALWVLHHSVWRYQLTEFTHRCWIASWQIPIPPDLPPPPIWPDLPLLGPAHSFDPSMSFQFDHRLRPVPTALFINDWQGFENGSLPPVVISVNCLSCMNALYPVILSVIQLPYYIIGMLWVMILLLPVSLCHSS